MLRKCAWPKCHTAVVTYPNAGKPPNRWCAKHRRHRTFIAEQISKLGDKARCVFSEETIAWLQL